MEGVFVRLSSRSPKDAALLHPDFMKIYEKEREKVEGESKNVFLADPSLIPTSETNSKLHALYRVFIFNYLLFIISFLYIYI